jgi:phospholipase C
MPFNLTHTVVFRGLEPERHETPQGTFFTVAAEGSFQVLYPGRFERVVTAEVDYTRRVVVPDVEVPDPPTGIDDPPGGPGGLGGQGPGGPPGDLKPFTKVAEQIPLTLHVTTPDGTLFTADVVTLADVQRYRDLRGVPRFWRFALTGRSDVYVLQDGESLGDERGLVHFLVHEAVPSRSAPPLIDGAELTASRRTFTFDLYRVGRFEAIVRQRLLPWRGTMTLIDPDGEQVASTPTNTLGVDIPLAALAKSRGPGGTVRPWSLQVSPSPQTGRGTPRLTATVVGRTRVGTGALHDRLRSLLGPADAPFVRVFGENVEGRARARMVIDDRVAAETIDMLGLLDGVLRKSNASTDIEAGVPFTIFNRLADLGDDLVLDVSDVRTTSIGITVGPGAGLGGRVPAVRFDVGIAGEFEVKWHGLTLAEGGLRDGTGAMEIGIELADDGTPQIVTWVTPNLVELDFTGTTVALFLAATGLLVGAVAANRLEDRIQSNVNRLIRDGAQRLFDDPTLAPSVLMRLFGDHLTYRSIGVVDGELVFEYFAPAEPDPKPRQQYHPAIGRALTVAGPDTVRFRPIVLPDTWATPTLRERIEHIVVVMMENRSYDHVLGYRSLPAIGDGADGLTPQLLATVAAAAGPNEDFRILPLRDSALRENEAGRRTRIPSRVGHELADVRAQLAATIARQDQPPINHPSGFFHNFRQILLNDGTSEAETGLRPTNVLGYYDGDDLPMSEFLAEHYGYSDRYFCSHPGPTLPNRMYSLTGDVQYDRIGAPILDNNHGDQFALSRAQTIYDVLTQRGVSWRVYESPPSVTMLRMFARYATNDTDIRPIDELEAAAAAGDVPALTVIEPAMHHFPPNDDHPPADMWRGQLFLADVYKWLRANEEVWAKTLLLITWDEHGGLFDHVVPPLAEVVTARSGDLDPGGGASPSGGKGRVIFGRRGGLGGVIMPDEAIDAVTPDAAQQAGPLSIRYGVRVPTFVVSPWVEPGKGPSIVLDHCSILKTVLARFAGDNPPFMSERVAASHSFESFLTAESPRLDVPPAPALQELTDASPIVAPGGSRVSTPTVSRRQIRDGTADAHELTGWVARLLGR